MESTPAPPLPRPEAAARPRPRPGAAAPPRLAVASYGEDLRPGNRHVLEALAAAPAAAPGAAPGAARAAAPARAEDAPARGIGDAHPERRQFHRDDTLPERELTFDDVLDILNPLQHIPLVGTLYRELTGDQLSGAARVMGGTLYGGPLGLVASSFNAVAVEAAGGDPAALAAAAAFDDAPAPQVAAQDRAAPRIEKAPPQVAGAAAGEQGIGEQGASERIAGEPSASEPGAGPGDAGEPAASERDPNRAPLTGAAALGALAADLRGQGRAPAGPAPTAMPAAPAAPAAAPAAGPGANSLFAARMFEALDKYEALATEDSPGRVRRLDRDL